MNAADEENLEEFCRNLQELIEQVPKGDVLIIIGEAAAPRIATKHGLGIRNKI